MPDMQCPPVILPALQKRKRYKILFGGRGSGKSMTVGDACLKDVQVSGLKVGCFREYQASIEDSVLSLLATEIQRLDLKGFDVLKTSIDYKGGEAFKFRGLARNPDNIRSMHGFHRFWTEEAQTISNRSLRAMTPTLRAEESEIWMTANPMSSADPFSQRFIIPYKDALLRDGYYEDEDHLIIRVNYSDNPYFPSVLERERVIDQSRMSAAEYAHVWEGAFNDSVSGSIIPVEWYDAAIDAHERLGFKPTGAKVASFDPSDEGGDSKGYALRQGSVFLDVTYSDEGDINTGCDWAVERASDSRADIFTWDCDGLGIGLKRQIAEGFKGRKVDPIMFKGSETPDDPDGIYRGAGDNSRDFSEHTVRKNRHVFRNKRAQYYWRLKDRFYATYRAVEYGDYIDPDTMISLSSDISCLDALRSEICRIPKKPNPNGVYQIMSKLDMSRMDPPIPSPNMSDSCMMSMLIPAVPTISRFRRSKPNWRTA